MSFNEASFVLGRAVPSAHGWSSIWKDRPLAIGSERHACRPEGHRRSPVCAATCQNGFCGVDHGVRAIAPRAGLLPGSWDAQFARPLNLLRHSGRLTMRRAGHRRRRGGNAVRHRRRPRQNVAPATDCAQATTIVMILRPVMMLPAISDLLAVREGACAAAPPPRRLRWPARRIVKRPE